MNDKLLDNALRLLADENAATPPPPDLEAKVIAAFDSQDTRRRRGWHPVMAMAMVVSVAAGGIFVMHQPVHRPAPVEAHFVAIPYVAPPAPYERTEVKRMDVPLAALLAAGIKVPATVSKGSVEADVLMGQDGRPLAIRLI